MALDPVVTNQNRYKVVFENERVRVLEYTRQKPASVAPLRATAVHGTDGVGWAQTKVAAPPDSTKPSLTSQSTAIRRPRASS